MAALSGRRWIRRSCGDSRHDALGQLELGATAADRAGGALFGAVLIGAWKALRRKAADMNTLITLGAGSAFLYSTVVTLGTVGPTSRRLKPPVYFEAAADIIALILLGRMLEMRARGGRRKASAS